MEKKAAEGGREREGGEGCLGCCAVSGGKRNINNWRATSQPLATRLPVTSATTPTLKRLAGFYGC